MTKDGDMDEAAVLGRASRLSVFHTLLATMAKLLTEATPGRACLRL